MKTIENDFWNIKLEELISQYETAPKEGLSNKEAESRKNYYGLILVMIIVYLSVTEYVKRLFYRRLQRNYNNFF